MSESPPFVVVKFLSADNDEDEYYEVALSKWLQDLDENLIGSILWPGDNSTAGTLVRTQVNAQSNWSIYAVEVKRYYDTYFHARKGLAGIIEYASAYETDTGKEMGRGKRKKKKNPNSSSSESDNDQHLENQVKKKKPSIPSPPAIHVPEASTSVDKISSHKGKRNIIEDSSNIKESKVARHLGKPISSENNRQKLIDRIISERKKTMEKAEEKKNAMLRSVSSKVLQSSSQNQSKLSTSFSKHFVKSSPKKILSKPKTREKVKSSKNSTPSEVSLQASSCASENQFTPEKETSIVSPSKVYNRKSDDSPRSPQKSPSSSSEKVDTSLSAQEKHSPLSSKKKLDPLVRNLSNFFSATEKTLEGISSKLEVVIMNQTNLNRSLLPEQAVINRPSNLPSLPLRDIKGLEEFEKFLSNDVNLSAA
ncbi:uncharacterized protein LOC112464697, partial [Temnothorax curvispinosus]|uniref:Uncharacterized protein LOC112464697 n=1 Tax=Temnothorax curvispinosus TaxID=300111 RepID=A0A6J1QZ40_9HYME